MQKLITICVQCQDIGTVNEHLTDFLTKGWRVVSVTATSCSTDAGAMVWLAVVLDDAPAPVTAQAALPVIELPQSEEGKPVEPSDIPVRPDTPLEIGSTVLSFSQGRWWRAQVIGLEPNDSVRLHFPGWDAKWDVTVSRDELQVDLHGFRE